MMTKSILEKEKVYFSYGHHEEKSRQKLEAGTDVVGELFIQTFHCANKDTLNQRMESVIG